MNSLTLIKPGDESVHLDYVGDGIVLRKRGGDKIEPVYYATNQEAKEGLIMDAYELIQAGYRVFTGDGVTS